MHAATNTLPAPPATRSRTRTRPSFRRAGDRARTGARNRRHQLNHSPDQPHTPTHHYPRTPSAACLSTITFRSAACPIGRIRTRRSSTPAGAIRPATVEISGATVRVTWGWSSTREHSWHRRDVGFVCSSRAADGDSATARLILITDKSRGDAVIATLACDGFPPEVYAALTRHLRNVEAIGDAERSDPLARLGAGPSAYPHMSR